MGRLVQRQDLIRAPHSLTYLLTYLLTYSLTHLLTYLLPHLGWSNDKTSSEFLNNRYMNNTCRIAAGHLGSLLGTQRPDWDFSSHPLTPNGRSALWFITDENDVVGSINVSQNDVSSDDVPGLAKMLELTYLLTYSLTYLLTYSLTYLLTYLLTY